jgi:hypothetical protein
MPGNVVTGAEAALARHFIDPATGDAIQQLGQRYAGAGPNILADKMGLPQYDPGLQTALGHVVEGTASGVPFGGLAALAGASGAGGSETAKALGAGPRGQAIAGVVASVAVPAIQAGATTLLQKLIAGTEEQRQTSQALRSILVEGSGEGNPGTIGQVSPKAQALENKLRQSNPDAFRQALANQETGLQQRAQSVLDVGPNDPEAAGQAMKVGIEGPPPTRLLANQSKIDAIIATGNKGPATEIVSNAPVTQGFIPKFRRTSEALYQRAISMVPDETPVTPQNLYTWLKGRLAQKEFDPQSLLDLKDPESTQILQQLHDNLATKYPNGTPFATLWNLRKALDDDITSFSSLAQAASPKKQQTLIQLRSALTKDLEVAVIQNGGKPAAAAWNQAQSYYAKRMDQIESIYQPLIDKNTPEQIFQAALSGTKRGASIARQAMRPLNPEQKQLVLGSILNDMMTKATPAGRVVDLDKLVTRWEGLTPQMQGVLLQHLGAAHANNLNRVMDAVKLINQAAPSLVAIGKPGTFGVAQSGLAKLFKMAPTIGSMGVGGSVSAGMLGQISPAAAVAGTAVSGMVAGADKITSQLLVRALTSPKTTAWLLQTASIPAGALIPAAVQLGKTAQHWDDKDKAVAQDLSDAITAGLKGPGAFLPSLAPDATAVH